MFKLDNRAATASQAPRLPRILHLRTVTGRGGGPEKTLLNSPRFLSESYELRLAYLRPKHDPLYDLPQRAAQARATLIDIPESGPLDGRALAEVFRQVSQFRPQLLHAHDYKTNFLSVILGRCFGIPVITTAHGYVTQTQKLNWYYRVDRWSLRRMERVVAVSEELVERVASYGVPRRKIVFVENAIDTAVFSRRRAPAAAKNALQVPEEDLLIGAVGRLSEEKAFDRLILAVDRLLVGGISCGLVIIGDGDQREALQHLIIRLKRQREIRLVGHQSDPRLWYEAMDVFALSSLREGLPNVLLEAMSLETPVIATRVAGVPRLVQDESNGLLVEPDDVDGLTAGLRRLLTSPSLRAQLRQAGRRTIEERYSFAVRMEKIRRIYDEVLGRGSDVLA